MGLPVSKIAIACGSTSAAWLFGTLEAGSKTGAMWMPGVSGGAPAWGTMWQDNLGATPVTALEQTVGFQMDRRHLIDGPVYGANVWSHASATVSGESQIISAGVYRLYSTGALSTVNSLAVLTAGKSYLVEFTIDSIATSGLIALGDVGPTITTALGRVSGRVLPNTNTYTTAFLKRSGALDVQISNVSFREILIDAAIGPDVVTNGNFSNGTTSWTNYSTGTGSWTVSGGASSIVGTDGSNRGWFAQALSLTPGTSYLVTMDVTVASGTINLIFGTSTGSGFTSTTTSGTKQFIATAAGATIYVGGQTGSGGGNGTVDNITVKELKGTHKIQATSAARPTLSGRYNLLQYTDQLDNAIWIKTRSTVTANLVAGPRGTAATADKLVEDSTATNSHYATQSFTTAAASYTFAVSGKAAERQHLFLFHTQSNSGAVFNLSTGAITTASGIALATAAVLAEANGWWRCQITVAATAATNAFSCFLASSSTVYLYTGDAASGAYVTDVDVRLAADTHAGLPYYQRVGNGTAGVWDYDLTGPMTDGSTGTFPVYLRAQVDDGMATTRTMDFTGTDEVFTAAAVGKLSDTASMLFEFGTSTSSVDGSFGILAPSASVAKGYSSRVRGTVTSDNDPATVLYGSPALHALSLHGQISTDTNTTSINGVLHGAAVADQGTGNFGNHTLYAYSRANTSLFFNGRDYGMLVADATGITSAWRAGLTKDLAFRYMNFSY